MRNNDSYDKERKPKEGRGRRIHYKITNEKFEIFLIKENNEPLADI